MAEKVAPSRADNSYENINSILLDFFFPNTELTEYWQKAMGWKTLIRTSTIYHKDPADHTDQIMNISIQTLYLW